MNYRQCLWILGNEKGLSQSDDSAWKSIVQDAKDKKCFHNVDEDKDLFRFVVEVKNDLDQLEASLDSDNLLFKNATWKVSVI